MARDGAVADWRASCFGYSNLCFYSNLCLGDAMNIEKATKGVYVMWKPYYDNTTEHFHQIIAGAMYNKPSVLINGIRHEVPLDQLRAASLDEIKKGLGL